MTGDDFRTVMGILGPTNTGKTHYALERMLARESGIIGLPLRLLAREIYDRIVGLRGPSVVALLTGEEKIVPARARYWVCTVEAMPTHQPVDFVAVDEIQLCADPERGHVFTDRLLHARGRYETLFLGAETVRARIAELVPGVQFDHRVRFSTLSYAGEKKISRLKPRTAVVAFSADQVYAIAELIRRQRGGAAVVMGNLSPRTRNAQVALYQEGDVDYMVATDAIGMGLNMDVDHVAFAGLSKFDGIRHRLLAPNELAQIAGRAGRYRQNGSFGVTGEAAAMDPQTVEAIENHSFQPVRAFMWRNSRLDFASVPALIASLEAAPDRAGLMRAREADDLMALRLMWENADICRKTTEPAHVRLLWDVCQTPDFRKTAPGEHVSLLMQIYGFLLQGEQSIPDDWIAAHIKRINRVEGDIDTLSRRLAFIRTWTFVANRSKWVVNAPYWQEQTRALEDRLSDALHARLTQRFVDRRTSVLMRRLKQKERFLAEVNDKGEVHVDGQYLGRLDGFRFTVDETATGEEIKTLRAASLTALAGELARRADRLYLSPDQEIDLTDQGGLMWGEHAIGRLARSDDPCAPSIEVFIDDTADPEIAQKIERRLRHWLTRRIAAQFEPLFALRDDETITGLARGVAFRLVENFGILPRRMAANDIKALAQEDRGLLRKHGVRFGQHFIFMPALLKPAPTRLRVLLWALASGLDEVPDIPPPGHVTIPKIPGAPDGYYAMAGYRLCAERALRIDMLERLSDLIRVQDVRAGFEATTDMLSITGCTLDQFAQIMGGLGYRAERGERPKAPRVVPKDEAETVTDAPKGQDDAATDMPVAGLADMSATVNDPEQAAQPGADDPDTSAPSTPSPPMAPAPADGPVSEDTPQQAPDVQEATPPADGDTPAPQPDEPDAAQSSPEPVLETFYTFSLQPRAPRSRPRQGSQPGPEKAGADGSGQPSRRQTQDKGRSKRGEKSRNAKFSGKKNMAQNGKKSAGPHTAKPKRSEKPIDPDNPFAVLQQLKNR